MIPLHRFGSRRFSWFEGDVSHLLPGGWQEAILEVAGTCAVDRVLRPQSVTSRESDRGLSIPVRTVGGRVVRERLPWLYDLYRGTFRDSLEQLAGEAIAIAGDDRYAINLNVQAGTAARYECHVDSNPWEGLLYVTTHAPGSGGELVVANRSGAIGPEAIEVDCARIHPVTGRLVFFDAREFPHFVAPLRGEAAIRVVAAMNFYTSGCPETARPADLNRHLFGAD